MLILAAGDVEDAGDKNGVGGYKCDRKCASNVINTILVSWGRQGFFIENGRLFTWNHLALQIAIIMRFAGVLRLLRSTEKLEEDWIQ